MSMRSATRSEDDGARPESGAQASRPVLSSQTSNKAARWVITSEACVLACGPQLNHLHRTHPLTSILGALAVEGQYYQPSLTTLHSVDGVE